MRPSFVFDQNKCTGCQACQLACVIENELEPDASWRAIHTFNERHYPGAPLFHISLACNHCLDPACMNACPALAYSKDSETGAVLVDEDKCIGCRYCTWACPYEAPKFDASKGVISKCTFCNDRIKGGSQPACVELCPTGALTFNRLPATAILNHSAGFTPTDMEPAIKIIPLRTERTAPRQATQITDPILLGGVDSIPSRVTLRTEWPLAAFTLLTAALYGLATAAVATGVQVSSSLFLTCAALGMGLATLHLGRKRRAWRAVLNVGRSWLSREVSCFSLFVPVALLYLTLGRGPQWLGWMAVGLGTATVLSMDMVYKFAIKPAPGPHSSSVFLTGLFLAGVIGLNPVMAGAAGAAKLALYLWRKTALAAAGKSILPLASAARMALGFAVPLMFGVVDATQSYSLIVASVLLAELIDRGEFYSEIDIMTPARQMAWDLTETVQAQLPSGTR
jgi:DMSO reductase iron-sulfur subunit